MNLTLKFTEIPKNSSVTKGKISSVCAANIALIKYWGKFEYQIPANPSISFTLRNSHTQTELQFNKCDEFSVKVFLDKQFSESFSYKIKNYFLIVKSLLPFITDYSYKIKTYNNFPHSSGIASSASGFGAIAKLLIQMRKLLFSEIQFTNELQETSFLACLGSGSACRSIYNGLVVWGKSKDIPKSSDQYAIKYPFELNEIFKSYHDTILIIHEKEKSVSSSIGHSLMHNHPYAELRFKQANENLSKLIPILKNGNLNKFIQLIESEALSLHAMMMLSSPPYILIKPNTLACIEKIWIFRKKMKIPIGFTLDAGANIHLLYPEKDKNHVKIFIENSLLKYTFSGNCIYDQVNF